MDKRKNSPLKFANNRNLLTNFKPILLLVLQRYSLNLEPSYGTHKVKKRERLMQFGGRT